VVLSTQRRVERDPLGGERPEGPGRRGRAGATLALSLCLLACSPVRDWGEVISPADSAPLRRMSTVQYANTVADLFPDASVRDFEVLYFPSEVAINGFVNNAEATEVNPALAEAYVSTARQIAGVVVGSSGRLDRCGKNQGCIERYLHSKAERAWRRPLTLDEATQISEQQAQWADEMGVNPATELSLQYLLLAPEFLYFPELGDESQTLANGEVPLTAFELAARLSYLLWNTLPDDELRALAKEGSLLERPVLVKQLRRMLKDEQTVAGLRDFGRQWLDLDLIANAEVDLDLFFPHFGDNKEDAGLFLKQRLQPAMEEEVQLFLQHHILEERATLSTLLTTNESFTNGVLASRYGVDVKREMYEADFDFDYPRDNTMYRVLHDPDQRRGVLTLAGVLHARSKPLYPSPVLRGLFVKERLLCQQTPPPPMDVPPLESVQETEPETNRDRFEVHTSDPACQSCHESIDGLGFTFEHYDSLGMYRARDNGHPIRAQGEIHNTDVDQKVSDALELTDVFSESRDVHDCYAEHWRRYAFGRLSEPSDVALMGGVGEGFWDAGGDVQELILNLAASHAFRHRQPIDSEVSP
jgi:hypothetical protein